MDSSYWLIQQSFETVNWLKKLDSRSPFLHTSSVLSLVIPLPSTAVVSSLLFWVFFLVTSALVECNTRYYANYYVRKDDTGAYSRTFYAHDFDFIHTAEHFFMETRLCELFANMMVTSWYIHIHIARTGHSQTLYRTSATNCSRIYNSSFTNEDVHPSLPAVWDHWLEMTVDDVWNGFFIYSLLLDHLEHDSILQLDHKAPSQVRRLQPALQARNARMRGTGQEHWNHACDLCSWVFTDQNGIDRRWSDCVEGFQGSYLFFRLLAVCRHRWHQYGMPMLRGP